MPGYPRRTLPREIVGVLAEFFAGGSGPSATGLMSAIAATGMPALRGFSGNKEARVHAAFEAANLEQSYRLVDEIVLLLHNDSYPTANDHESKMTRARITFDKVGATLDRQGHIVWGEMGQRGNTDRGLDARANDPLAGPIVGITAAASAARRAVAPPSGEVERPSENGVTMTSEAYSAGDIIGRHFSPEPDRPSQVFLVHGHDSNARNAVESFVNRTTGIVPTVLALESNRGRTVIEKFEEHASTASFAIVLMTADDEGRSKADVAVEIAIRPRARQNVVFEFGYFVGAVGRRNTVALVSPGVELPSDIAGVIYIDFISDRAEWREELRDAMRDAGVPIVR